MQQSLVLLKTMSPLPKRALIISVILLGIFLIMIISQKPHFEAVITNAIAAANDIVAIEENATVKETSDTVNSSETTNKKPVYYAIYDSHTPNGIINEISKFVST